MRGRGRSAVAWVLVVLSGGLVPLVITAQWLRNTVLDTNQYVVTVAPLAYDRQFTELLATQVTNVLYQALPADEASNAAVQQERPAVQEQVTDALAGPSFPTTWDAANRSAQEEAVAVLTGRPHSGVQTSDGLTVDLSPILDQVLQNLDQANITTFDQVAPALISGHQVDVTLLSASQLNEARSVFRALIDLEWWLLAAAVVALVVGILLGRRRWRLAVGFALAVLVSSAVTFGLIALTRSLVESRAAVVHVDGSVSVIVFDTVDRYLRSDLVEAMAVAGGVTVALVVGGLLRDRYRPPGSRGV